MKLKKNDLIAIRKGGQAAVQAKLVELAQYERQLVGTTESTKITRRTKSQLKTLLKELAK